ncbi:MAG: OmpH family outer membrane protein [bacterium]
MKKIVFLLAGILLFVFTASSFALTVGYVDIEKVFSQYKGTADAKNKLQKEVEKEQKNVEKDKDDILKAKAELDKKKSILDKSKVAEEEKALQEKAEKLQSKAMEIQQKLLSQEKELTANIVEEIRAIVQKIAKEKSYDYIFEKNTVLYGGEDVTYLVIKKMNE